MERHYAENTILQREKDELKQVVSAWKVALSGRRSIIKGKHVLTMTEILAAVREAEYRTTKKKTSQAHNTQSVGANVTSVSEERFDDNIETEMNEDSVVMDNF